MFGNSLFSIGLATFVIFVLSDLVYVLDHYFVHFDRQRYRTSHMVHHVRYARPKDAPHLDRSEVQTYGTAAITAFAGASVLTLFTGNIGFALGVVLKFIYTLLFHLYQHRWWGSERVRAQPLGVPRRTWGLATARYHAYHHSHPNQRPFTYAETWAGWDRILEWAHPWLYRFTAEGRSKQAAADLAGEPR